MNQLTPPDHVEIFETPLLLCWFGEDGILYSKSKVADRTIENYNLLFELYNRISENGSKKICTLGDITKTQPLGKEVREYISKELPKYIKAMALMSDTPLGKTVGNILTTVNPQSYPTQSFNDHEEAVLWLKQYL
jgi:hypothetical protein